MAFSSWIRNWKHSIERRWKLYQTPRRKAVARRLATRPHLEFLEDRWLLSTYAVTSAGDSGAGTLRDAITQANAPGSTITEIDFNIGTQGVSSGVQTISPATPLPALTASGVFINGSSENQWQGVTTTSPLIELNGVNLGKVPGLDLTGASNTVSGLIIESFTNGIEVGAANNVIGGTTAGAGNVISGNTNAGVLIDSGISGVAVQGNYIGTDVTGTQSVANSDGIDVGGSNNTIGGTTSGARNIISGNSADGVIIDSTASGVSVQGNYIGTDVTGTKAVAVAKPTNSTSDVAVNGSNNTIGGTATGARNVISGSDVGVTIYASGVQVQGNYIGTNAGGNAAVANFNGVVAYSSSNTIGGTAAGARNVISGNRYEGVVIDGSDVQVQGNYIGTDVTGTIAVANGTLGGAYGIFVGGSSNTIGGSVANAANIIANNAGGGVYVSKYVSTGNDNTIRLNSIYANGSASIGHGPGITLNDGNNNLAAPSLTSTSTSQNTQTVTGSFTPPTANVSYILDFYANSSTDAEGKVYLGSLTVTPTSTNSQSFTFTTTTSVTSKYPFITATLTDASGNTSEFSNGAPDDKYLVTSTADDRSAGTLRDAINQANNPANGITEIDFSIGTVGSAQTINLTDALPTLTASGVYINGLSQGGSGNTTQLVELNGSGAGSYSDGLDLYGSNCTVSGLIIENFSPNGIEVGAANNVIGGTTAGAGNVISGNTNEGVFIEIGITGVAVQGNYIGTDVSGTQSVANSDGIDVGGSNNTIGGTTSGARNIISGNLGDGVFIDNTASGVLVQGNYIGTDPTGTKAVGNGVGIEVIGSSNTIGGTAAGAGNVISGNSSCGVALSVSGVTVEGNYIGTDATGTKAVGNSVGIEVVESANTIGGTVSGAGNVISGNSSYGVWILASGVTVQGNFIGTNLTGTSALANRIGVEVDKSSSTIGGTATGAGNVISGNSYGVALTASGVTVQGNYIGTNAAGSAALANSMGIDIGASNNTVGGTAAGAGNVISGNTGEGVGIGASGVQVQGNYIGINAAGSGGLANATGISVVSPNNTIGGTASGARNVISGNKANGIYVSGSGVAVLGNYIGTDATGTNAIGNSSGVFFSIFGANSTIGGTTSGARNVISGNSTDGVLIDSGASGVQVQGNYIGTDVTGSTSVGNRAYGIYVASSNNNTIGGTSTAARNIISGNSTDGVYISASGVAVQGNYIGTDAIGADSIANPGGGVLVDGPNNTIGGTISGARNVISGNINGFSAGIIISGSSSTGNLVQGNYIGINAAGSGGLANPTGISVVSSNNTIGGTTSGARNVISGNKSYGIYIGGSGVAVLGNYIGTDATGTIAIGNSASGVLVYGSNNTIGGTTSGARNVISGNTHPSSNGSSGIQIGTPFPDVGGTGNQVQGNYIGTNAAGSGSLDSAVGINVFRPDNTIGGTATGAGNVISGNETFGIYIVASAVTLQGNFIGTDATGANAIANGGGCVFASGSNNILGGTASGARNVISGNTSFGVLIATYNSGVLVQGNYIGTDATGTKAVANSVGVADYSSSTIGGTTTAAGNVISGNTSAGVRLYASGVQVQGNYIGTDVTGTNAVANGTYGIFVGGSSNTIGGSVANAANILANNAGGGVYVSTGSGNTIRLNSIFDNGPTNTGPGITLINGNNDLAAPSLASATLNVNVLTVMGSFTPPAANVSYVLDFYANLSGDAEGKVYLGSETVTPTSTSPQSFIFRTITSALATYPLVTATLNDASGDTSSFSNGVTTTILPPSSVYVVTSTADDGSQGTLRDAINQANAAGSTITLIDFNIGTSGTTAAIDLTSQLPALTANDVVINGLSQGGSGNTTQLLTLNGINAGSSSDGLLLQGANGAVWGLILENFGANGIEADGPNNIIGGTMTGAGNILSANSNDGVLIDSGVSGVQVQGNYIGTGITGSKAVANATGVEDAGSNNTIGGTAAGDRNIISGNSGDGVLIDSGATGVAVQGNYIGTDVTGAKAVANSQNGVVVAGATNTIGGTVTGAGNVISGSSDNGAGVQIDSGVSGVQVEGNYIGTDATGTKAVGNYFYCVPQVR